MYDKIKISQYNTTITVKHESFFVCPQLSCRKFEEEQREAFEAKAEKGRRDRTYLLNLIRSSSLDESTAVKSLRARQGSTSSSHEGADDVFNKPKRRESAPTRPINIASGPNVNYPGVPTALTNLGRCRTVGLILSLVILSLLSLYHCLFYDC